MIGRLGNVAVVCAATALCYFMQNSKPHYADLIAPIPVDAAMDETATARTFGVRVDRITFARALSASRFGQEKLLTTGGIWAVVETSLAATSSSAVVSEAAWRGPTGLTYRMSERVGFAPGLPPHSVEPGLGKRGRFVFEVPPDQIHGATLLVSAKRFASLDSQVRIGLDQVPLDGGGQPAGVVAIYDLATPDAP
jgi:hypothetical protein